MARAGDRAIPPLPGLARGVLRRCRGRRGRRHGHGDWLLRETSPHNHAEEAALAKIDPADPRLAGATLYSSLEPCRSRASRPTPCAQLIIEAGLRRVVIAWLEPPVFAPGGGAAKLREAGISVVEIPGLAAEARAVNAAVLSGRGPGAPAS